MKNCLIFSRLLLLGFVILLIDSNLPAQSRKQKKALVEENIHTTRQLKSHVYVLAADSLEGRRAGTEGERKAAAYIADWFQEYGLIPAGTKGYLQPFEINEGKNYQSATNRLSINGQELIPGKEYYPLAFSASGLVSSSLTPSVKESGEAWFFDVSDWLEENENNPHFDIYEMLQKEAARSTISGAKALIVYNSGNRSDNILFNKFDTSSTSKIPVVFLTKAGVERYLPDPSLYVDLDVQISIQEQTRTAYNIAGFIDNHAAHTVVVGAHYDHLGYGEDGNSLDGTGNIHNGADDNASGTAALLEMARLLKKPGYEGNNYLFLAFSGEELGLIGSKYWLSNPSYKISNNYMINMDMIGRYDSSRQLTVGGYGTSPTWSQVYSAMSPSDLKIKFDSSGTGPSDHASFYRAGVPVLFFFTNSHSDYHKAGDDADKIEYGGLFRIVQHILSVIKASNDKGRLSFLTTRDPEIRNMKMPVTLGVMPDYGFTGTGMRIDGVSKGKIAERIGLQAGDVLLQLGQYKFVDVPSYMGALQHFKKGDSTKLIILRGDQELTFEVTF